MRHFIITAILCLVASTSQAGAKYDEKTKSLTISGGTTSFLSIQIANAVNGKQVDTVFMSGPGGLFYHGMAIGHMIKNMGARVIIPSGKECVSACALAALGSADVLVDGKLLLHRPRFNQVPTSATIEEIAGMAGRGYLDQTKYLVKMGFPFALSEQIIWETSPCKFISMTTENVKAMRGLSIFAKPTMKFAKDDKC